LRNAKHEKEGHMKKGIDLARKFPGLFLVHHNLPEKNKSFHNKAIHHLIIPIAGNVQVQTEGNTFSFGPGKMIYIPDHSSHNFFSKDQNSGERLVAIFDQKFWKKSFPPFPPTLLPALPLIKELLLYLLLHPKTTSASIYIKTIVEVLVETLSDLGQEMNSVDQLLVQIQDLRLQKAISFIEEAKSGPLSIPMLAKESGLSTRNLNRLFSESLGLTPKQAHTQLKIKYAQELLRQRKFSVTEVAFEVGMNSLSQFIVNFKKITGKLPSEEI